MNYDARRVLLCLRYGIGDVVMELPVIEALRAALPRARITGLGAFPATQLLEGHPAVDEVVAIDRWGIRQRWDRGAADTARLVSAWLDENDFDLFLDVHHVTPVIGEAVWSRGVRSLEADERAESRALRAGADGVEAIRSAVEEGWGLPVPGAPVPRLAPPQAEREWAAEFLRRHGMEGVGPFAVSPVASLALKQWPIERLAGVADWMVEACGTPVLAFCGPCEDACDALRRRMRHGERLVPVGPFHLLRMAALLQRCRAIVCNDTGLMHMAGALRLPTVAVFGPTSPSVYRPPADPVAGISPDAVPCPHRRTDSLHPPACFAEGRCLIAPGSCIEAASEEGVLAALAQLIGSAESSAGVERSVA
jgi:ADP-heptose:LPS heptosyltransferase